MSDAGAHVADFRVLIARRLGLWFEDHRMDFLADVLRERAGWGGQAAYLAALDDSTARGEWSRLASLLTVPETYFLRGRDHYRALIEALRPEWLASRPVLRFLSAGCASGEEAYSLAILAHEHAAAFAGRRVEILGVDINPVVLARGRAARFSSWSLRETPADIRARYFRLVQGEYVLDPAVASFVTLQERNLAEPNADLWRPGSYDAVFCRNMLMYLVPEVAAEIVARIAQALAPGGYLFLGHAESLRGLSREFDLRRHEAAFFYQLRPEAEAGRQERFQVAPPESSPASPLSAAADAPPGEATTWYEEIGRSSARIAMLVAETPVRPATVAATAEAAGPAKVSPRPGADIAPILDLHRQERFGEALACLRELMSDASPDADLEVMQAMLLVNCGRVAEAEDLCRPLLDADRLDARARHVVALCREHAGDLAAAEEHAAAAAYLDPSFAMPRYHLALLCKRRARLAEALGHFEAALALLLKEDAVRLLLFGGGFSREALVQACRGEIGRLHHTRC